MIIELQNCELDINYIGTREEIQLQIVIETAKTFLESYKTFGKSILEANVKVSDAYYPLLITTMKLWEDFLSSGQQYEGDREMTRNGSMTS